ncbi:MAG: recombination-associated protein RdgC [Deltaproteobacteria bacterium]|jgi:DNA recombination-dependent growth factor C|nr:recombination-associated protein RdgC [Deltaproteobacteria bacterium]
MGFVKGSATMTRYKITEEPSEGLTDEFIAERLLQNAFVDIENSSEESSLGWVEFFDHLSTGFPAESWRFGQIIGFNLRLDERKLSNRILNRYYAIAEANLTKETGKKPNTTKRRQLKEALRADLLRRSLLDTKLIGLLWLPENQELWIDSAGDKNRALFEELWSRTFGLNIKLLVPVSMGLSILAESQKEQLLRLTSVPFFEGE